MGRERLEVLLDLLFAERVTDAGFLEQCVEAIRRRSEQSGADLRIRRLMLEINALREKRSRVIETSTIRLQSQNRCDGCHNRR